MFSCRERKESGGRCDGEVLVGAIVKKEKGKKDYKEKMRKPD